MRVLNRTAVTVIGADPYLDWTRARDADFNRGTVTVARTKSYGSAFLLPESIHVEEELIPDFVARWRDGIRPLR